MLGTALLAYGVYQALGPVADSVSDARTKKIERERENDRQVRIGMSVQKAVELLRTARPSKAQESLVSVDWIPVFGGDKVFITGNEAARLQDVGDEEWHSPEIVGVLRRIIDEQESRVRAAQAD